MRGAIEYSHQRDKEHLHESMIKNDYANVQWNATGNSSLFNNLLPHHKFSSNKYHTQMHQLTELEDEEKRGNYEYDLSQLVIKYFSW